MRLHQVILFAKDVRALRDFYVAGLDCKPIDPADNEGWSRLDAGGIVLALHAVPPRVAARLVIDTPPKARSETPIKLTFLASDVAAARARLVAHGAEMGEIRRYREMTVCDGVDPEGNVFQIADA